MNRARQYALLFILVLLLGAVGLFAVQNSVQKMTISFAVWESNPVTAAVALFAAFLTGVLLTGVFSLFGIVNRDMRIRKARKLQASLEREIDALRNQPLYEEPAPAQGPRHASANPLLNEDR